MAKYLVQASYTADGVKGLLKDGGSGRALVDGQQVGTHGAGGVL